MKDARQMMQEAQAMAPAPPSDPEMAHRAALVRQPVASLVEILRALGPYDRSVKPPELVAAIVDRLSDARFVEGLVSRAGRGARMALGLLALTESYTWPAPGLEHALSALGESPEVAVAELSAVGLLVPRRDDVTTMTEPRVVDWVAPPAAPAVARTVLPEGTLPRSGPARQVREADGLEPILRLAALWQRVDEASMRRTQQGSLYKRDRERVEEDPVLVGPIADSLGPLPDMGNLWLALARGVGLVVDEPHSDRTVAAPASFWGDNAFHLPQMIASRWLGMRTWHEHGGAESGEAPAQLAAPFLRPAALLWLATLGEGEWLALDDLAAHLDALDPGWAAFALAGRPGQDSGAKTSRFRPKSEDENRAAAGGRRKKDQAGEPEAHAGVAVLEAILLGPAYQLGLVRAAEEEPSGRRVVQLTPLGRYCLALGPPPPPRATFEHFLFVQPNFEIIAYRQGLNPALIGQLSRFARWTQSGAALEIKLTPESIYRGLEGGLTPEAMLDRLSKHSARPLPSGVSQAMQAWSSRRDRITYFAAATLVEFASAEALAEALAAWGDRESPVALTDRILLVEDESTIPFDRFRLAGSRDYRRPPEACVEVERDGVTLSLDLGRSDLFIDAEIAKLADEVADEPARGAAPPGRRRHRITPDSLRRAVEDGLTPAQIARWFEQRAGSEVPPAVRLLLHAAGPAAEAPRLTRPVVLGLPTADLLDGLLQHPSTRDLLGERLGPLTVTVEEGHLGPLRKALAGFGLGLDGA